MATPRKARVFPARPLELAGGRILPSPSQFYVTGEDRLRIVSACSLAGVVVQLRARIADFAGDTVPEAWSHTPNSDRTVRTEDFELGVGSLLNVHAFASAGSPRVGQCFVMVQLVRGLGTAALVLGTLFAGYVTSAQSLGYPGSPIQRSTDSEPPPRVITGSVPAVGAEILETVPTGARWRLVSAVVTFVTDVTAITRSPRLEFRESNITFALFPNPLDVTGSLTRFLVWVEGLAYDAPHSSNVGVGGLPQSVILLSNQTIRTNTENLQLGDQFTGIAYTVQEWLEVS